MTNISDLFDDIDEVMDDDEIDMGSELIVRGKLILEGAETLADAAELAREYADFLDNLHEAGYVLRDPIEDDYGFAYLP
jgi:hypothetical protein